MDYSLAQAALRLLLVGPHCARVVRAAPVPAVADEAKRYFQVSDLRGEAGNVFLVGALVAYRYRKCKLSGWRQAVVDPFLFLQLLLGFAYCPAVRFIVHTNTYTASPWKGWLLLALALTGLAMFITSLVIMVVDAFFVAKKRDDEAKKSTIPGKTPSEVTPTDQSPTDEAPTGSGGETFSQRTRTSSVSSRRISSEESRNASDQRE